VYFLPKAIYTKISIKLRHHCHLWFNSFWQIFRWMWRVWSDWLTWQKAPDDLYIHLGELRIVLDSQFKTSMSIDRLNLTQEVLHIINLRTFANFFINLITESQIATEEESYSWCQGLMRGIICLIGIMSTFLGLIGLWGPRGKHWEQRQDMAANDLYTNSRKIMSFLGEFCGFWKSTNFFRYVAVACTCNSGNYPWSKIKITY